MAKESEEETKTASIKKTKTRRGWKIAKRLLVTLIVIGSLAFGGYFYKQYNDLKKNPQSAEEAQKQENNRIIASVSKLYSLPTDEEPTIFFVSDKEKLSDEYKNQEFFQKAENGDYILIYENGKVALLYRPKEDRLVDVRPYTVQSSLSVAILGPEALRNASEKAVKLAFDKEITIKSKDDAKTSVNGVIVVDTSGKYADQAKKIADTLKGKVGALPAGETKPDGADIVILVGEAEPTPPPAQ